MNRSMLISALFSALNRNKRSAVIDLKKPEGKAAIEQLTTASKTVPDRDARSTHGIDADAVAKR